MGTGDIYLSRKGYEELREKLDHLKQVRRKEIAEELRGARAFGDLHENAEYEAAKHAQALNETRIAELEAKLARARLLDEGDIPKDEVTIGVTVRLKNVDTGEEMEYTLVSELEADFKHRKISTTSPVGKGLLCHRQGEIVEITVPAGTVRYQILEISRYC